ncbi:MAG: Na/Pi cotransporter family protein [bacterium]|nr:Na/Pi cotransporter family protein [bacterium]
MNNWTGFYLNFFGGLALFIYGMRLAGENIQRLAGFKLKDVIKQLTDSRLKAAFVGIMATLAIQSSNASIALVVGFLDSSLIMLWQGLALILGAHIGTALIVQLIAFNLSDFSLFFVFIGLLIILLLGKNRRNIYFGKIILSIGFIFLGMKILGDGMKSLENVDEFKRILIDAGQKPFLSIILSFGITVLTQSSVASIGMVIILASHGLLDLKGGLLMVLGSNLGSCVAVVAASWGAFHEGKRAIWANLLFKIIAAILFFLLLPVFEIMTVKFSSLFLQASVGREIANGHLLFNIISAIIFIPFINQEVKFLNKFVPEREMEDRISQIKYIKMSGLEMPSIGLDNARREVARMAKFVETMVQEVITGILENKRYLIDNLRSRDDEIDKLNRTIHDFLVQLAQNSLTDSDSKTDTGILYILNDIENIGDIVDKNLIRLGEKKINENISFSNEGEEEIKFFYSMIRKNFALIIQALNTGNYMLAEEIILKREELAEHERELHHRHISRLHQGTKETIASSAIHLDVLNNLGRINAHLVSASWAVLEELS